MTQAKLRMVTTAESTEHSAPHSRSLRAPSPERPPRVLRRGTPQVLRALRRSTATETPREAAAPRVQSDEPRNTLALYFREVAAHHVLSIDEERRATREIAELEREAWVALLTCAPVVPHALTVIEEALQGGAAPEVEAEEPDAGGLVKDPDALEPTAAMQLRTDLDGALTELRAAATAAVKRQGPATRKRLQDAAQRAGDLLRRIDVERRLPGQVLAALKKLSSRRRAPRQAHDPGYPAFLRDAQLAQRAATAHRDAFLRANLRLVIAMARRYRHDQMSLADLIQEGNLGLLKGLSRYDHQRGIKFSTYASWWIRHAITRALAEKGREVRLPVHLIDAQRRILRAERQLGSELGRQATLEELAGAMEMPLERLARIKTHLRDHIVSLDQPQDGEDGRELADRFRDPEHEEASALDVLEEQQLLGAVGGLLTDACTPIEADILRWRFGIGKDRELTLREVGERYGMSRERIRQLQEQALDKLRLVVRRRQMA